MDGRTVTGVPGRGPTLIWDRPMDGDGRRTLPLDGG